MKKFILKFYFIFILPPLVIIGGLAILSFSPEPATDPFSGLGNLYWFLFFAGFWLLMLLFSLPMLLSIRPNIQGNKLAELLLWFLVPVILDFIIIEGRINGNDFDIGLASANLMLTLAICNVSGLVIGYVLYKQRLKQHLT